MYHVIVSSEKNVIASSLQEGLADAVAYGRKKGQKGNRITVYDALQDATGQVVHLNRVLSTTITQDVA